MQFKIPQNVQQEDKIVGPLTLKQLIIVAVGGGASYFVYISLSKLYVLQVWLPFTAIPALLTLAVAFLKINGIPFLKFSLLEFERLLKPSKRRFVKGSGEVYQSCLAQIKPLKTAKKKINKEEEVKNMKDINELTKILDSQNNA